MNKQTGKISETLKAEMNDAEIKVWSRPTLHKLQDPKGGPNGLITEATTVAGIAGSIP